MKEKGGNDGECSQSSSPFLLPYFVPFTYADPSVLSQPTTLDDIGKGSSPLCEERLGSLDSLLKYFSEENAPLGILFRGHADATWKLESKAMRLYKGSGGRNDPSDLYNFRTQKLSVKMKEALSLPFNRQHYR